VNAAINLGLRAIAAPACIDIHRRLRATKEKERLPPEGRQCTGEIRLFERRHHPTVWRALEKVCEQFISEFLL